MSFRYFSACVLAVAVMVLASFASANVSLRNGNFYISYTDLTPSKFAEANVERTYNSKSPFRGMFGVGWGATFEVRLNVQADGSIAVEEHGGGATNYFFPAGLSETVKNTVDRIVEAARRAQGSLGGAKLSDYRKRLEQDSSYRSSEWERLSQYRTAPPIAVGTLFTSMRFGHETITKTPSGFSRTTESGMVQDFGENGRFVKVSDRNGNSASFERDENGRLLFIRESSGSKTEFHYNRAGLVSRVVGPNGKAAYYRYNARQELIYSRDVDDSTYVYKYSPDGLGNLIGVGYTDGTELSVAYYGSEHNHSVRQVAERDGSATTYGYKISESTTEKTTTVSVELEVDRTLDRTTYTYVEEKLPSGSRWLKRIIVDDEEKVTETEYHPVCFTPVRIKDGSRSASFDYDDRCHVVRKATDESITELSYDALDKIVSSTERDAKTGLSKRTLRYQYDAKGNLISASDGSKNVQLRYDARGRLENIQSPGENVSLDYNGDSKPVRISVSGVGELKIEYRDGAISKLDSTGGREVALKVTTVFQRMLDLVRPAGVSLSL